MNIFALLLQIFTFLGSTQGVNLIKKLEAIGADAGAVVQCIIQNQGLPAIEAALAKLLTDLGGTP